MHFGLNKIWDEFSTNKNRELITPILDVCRLQILSLTYFKTWVGSDLDGNVDTLSKAPQDFVTSKSAVSIAITVVKPKWAGVTLAGG